MKAKNLAGIQANQSDKEPIDSIHLVQLWQRWLRSGEGAVLSLTPVEEMPATRQRPKAFLPLFLVLIEQAQRLNKWSICLVYLPFFVIWYPKGLSRFKTVKRFILYFIWVPLRIVGRPYRYPCYVAFILYRYRLKPADMLRCVSVWGFGLFVISSYAS